MNSCQIVAVESSSLDPIMVMFEHIQARMARLQTRMDEYDRRQSSSHELRPDPEPPHSRAHSRPLEGPLPFTHPFAAVSVTTPQPPASAAFLGRPEGFRPNPSCAEGPFRAGFTPQQSSTRDLPPTSNTDLDPTSPQNKPQPQTPAAKPSQPLPHPSSSDEDDFGSDTESESDAPEVRPLAAKPVEETPKSNRKAKSKPAADPVTPGKSAADSKRPTEDMAVSSPQVVLSTPCSLNMINIAVQHSGKSSILDGEIGSIFTNQGTIGRIASRIHTLIMGVDYLKDINMGQVKIFWKDTRAFDPGGITREACYWRSSLLLDSHLEDKVDFNRGGVDTFKI